MINKKRGKKFPLFLFIYMTMIKTFENFNENLVDKLIEIVGYHDKNINGFSCFYDGKSGAIEWTTDKYTIYATPYWDGDNELPIEFLDNETQEQVIDFQRIKLDELKTMDDVKLFAIKYFEIIDELTKDIPLLIASQKFNL